MKSVSRRRFMQSTAGAIAATGLAGALLELRADPLGLPIGLQLYTVGSDLQKDFDGTLKTIADIGYKAVEGASFASFQGKSPADLRKAFSDVGLTCPSAHVVQTTLTDDQMDQLIDFCHNLGLQYMVCATTPIGPPAGPPQAGLTREQRMAAAKARLDALTPDDFKRTAEVFNKVGARINQAGMQFAYHNHALEFKDFPDGSTGMDVLIQNSEKGTVNYELDCGWVVYAGHDPVAMLKKYPDRIKMLHIKDEKPGYPPSIGFGGAPTTEVGKGKIDWKAVFEAAKEGGHIQHYFVEQEPPFSEMPPLQAIKVSYDYLHALKV
ncbi:MAG TPA: TIM barrel protein [Candidatus Aquilonibacter sp.]|nr:TIM barrel protein [Candidatus Aquilonibacter sp.]